MDIIQSIFQRTKLCPDALEPFGFARGGAAYVYTKELPGSGFEMTVTVTGEGQVSAAVIDPALREPYTLHLAEGAVGSFVGGIKAEYERLLREICEKCFEKDVFSSAQAREVIAYVRASYGDALAYLWQKFPDNAVWRRRDNGKWYGALLTVSKRKLGVNAEGIAEIIDLRADAEALEALIDRDKFFPGWHMNKKTWYTVILDDRVPTDEICRRIDLSYALAASGPPSYTNGEL